MDHFGEEDALLGDAPEPSLLLLLGGYDQDRVAAQEGRQDAGREPHVDARHRLADAIDIERTAAHAAELLGDEHELHAELFASNRADELFWKDVLLVELEQCLVGECAGRLSDLGVARDVLRPFENAGSVAVPLVSALPFWWLSLISRL